MMPKDEAQMMPKRRTDTNAKRITSRTASTRITTRRYFVFSATLYLSLGIALVSSGMLSGCGARKAPLPVEDLQKPRYPPR